MTFAPGDQFDRYVIAALLGQGGMGVVYRAHDPRLQRAVALKILHPELAQMAGSAGASSTQGLARLLREARAAAALEHPNAISVYDVGEVNGTAYLAMEFIAGETLRAKIRDATVGLEQRVRWLTDIARALGAAHKRGLVHGDIKPENAMLRDDGVVKVLDFGIARRIASPVDSAAPTEAAVTTSHTGKSGIAGTPAYMAPEQIRSRTVDASTDQFSWGVMAYELLTGRLPWAENIDALQLIAEIVTSRVPPPSATSKLVFPVPPEVDSVVLKALEKDPQQRFASMLDVVAALEPFAGQPTGNASRRSVPIRTTPPVATLPERPVRAPTPRWGRWAALGTLVVLAASGLAWRTMHTARPGATSTSTEPAGAPETSNPEARAAYVAATQAIRDATIDVAFRELKTAITLDPTFGAAYLRRALVAVSIDAQARDDFSKATELRSHLSAHDRELLHAFEPLMGSSPDPRLAAARFEEALRAAPGDAEFLFYLGKARWFDGNWDAAAQAFDEALARDPDSALTVRYKASSLAYGGKSEEAIALYQRCLARSPGATACAWDLARLFAAEGACDDEENLARDQIARNDSARSMHARLAEALFARGNPEPAVLEVLKGEWQRWDEASRAALEARDRARLEVLRGDFASAGAHATAWEEALGEGTGEMQHAEAIRLGLQIALEAGRTADARALVDRYETRHAAWSLDPIAPDESIQIDALSYSAGFIDRREFLKRRGAWLARNERRTLVRASSGPSDRWFQAYATPCVTADDAADALATLTGPPPSRFFETGADEVVGEMYRLAGKADEAVHAFSRQVRSCTALNEPFDSTLASYRLGELLESSADRTGACQQYGIVLARWGHAVPASRTASDAARRATSLQCPR